MCSQGRQDPGGLLKAMIRADVEFDANGVMETGLEALTTAMCYDRGHYMPCPLGRQTPLDFSPPLNSTGALCSALECSGFEFNYNLLHISYFYSIEHLWTQPGPPRPGEEARSG